MSFLPKNIGIYSVGLLGGSLGLALKNSGYAGRILGFSSTANLGHALELGCIDEGLGYDELPGRIAELDFLVLCSPINTILETIDTISKYPMSSGLIISDVGSTKKEIVAAAKRSLPDHVHFIGGHPMAGSEKSGASAADPYLFQNALYVLTPDNGIPSPTDRELADFLHTFLGCRYLFLDPATHDRIAAAVSHVPHLLAVALVCMADDVELSIEGALQLAAGGFRDMTRIASARYEMWHDILSTNKGAVESLLDAMIDQLVNIKTHLRQDTLRSTFERARDVRARIPATNKGFINQLSEVLVRAKDQPGVIAAIANALALEEINIKDIELLKVREGEGGTIRLAFESAAIAKRAVDVLAKNGFTARERT